MNKLLTSLIEFLEAQSIGYDADKEAQRVRLGIEGDNLRWRCLASEDDSGRFVFVSLIPVKAPEARRPGCAELLCRINARLGLGHFDLDFNDGELAFRTVVPVAKRGRLSADLIGHIFQGHNVVVDRFIPAITSVVFSGQSPEKALALLEESGEAAPAREQFSLN
jgi:hypothetical protein